MNLLIVVFGWVFFKVWSHYLNLANRFEVTSWVIGALAHVGFVIYAVIVELMKLL